MDHPHVQQSVASPRSHLVAEVRWMPEGSLLPYGQGVFLHPWWAVMKSFQSELAFAGYCASVDQAWKNDRRLTVGCKLSGDTTN